MKKKTGFTLVELVVVIMILGILAGVAAPKFLRTSADATDNGLRQTLGIIRNAIELYTAQNEGDLPPCSGDGTSDFHPALEPYLRGLFPACPVGANSNNLITVATTEGVTTADGLTGWMFNNVDGTFIVNDNSGSASGTGNYDTF